MDNIHNIQYYPDNLVKTTLHSHIRIKPYEYWIVSTIYPNFLIHGFILLVFVMFHLSLVCIFPFNME